MTDAKNDENEEIKESEDYEINEHDDKEHIMKHINMMRRLKRENEHNSGE